MRAHNVFSLYIVYFVVPLFFYFSHAFATTDLGGGVPVNEGPRVRKDERWPLVSTEFGEIAAVKISDGKNGCYHLHFITMNRHTLLLPVLLYTEMVLYVNSGNGTLSRMVVDQDDDKLLQIKLQKGDIYRLQPQSVFYLQNNLHSDDPKKLQIFAMFSDSADALQNKQFDEVYSGFHDLVLGFDNKILQSALNVPKEVIDELRVGERQPLIVQELPEAKTFMREIGSRVIEPFVGAENDVLFDVKNKKKGNKEETFNIFNVDDHDAENCYGWSVTVTKKQSDVFKHTDFGVFMVNLTKGTMMGPHWNPASAEIAIVLHGRGMVHVICPRIGNETMCKNSRFKVEEGDVFVVPKYHPRVQISFNNESLVFIGFTITSKKNAPQYVAGKKSLLQTLDKTLLAKSFYVKNKKTMDQVLSAQKESMILECTSCAEEEEKLMEEEAEREKDGEGGGGGGDDEGRKEADIEGEIARRGEEEMQRRWREAEEVATRGRVVAKEGGNYDQ